MFKIILKLLFKVAKRFALKKLESMLAEYMKDKFADLVKPPKAPKLSDMPSMPTVEATKEELKVGKNGISKAVLEKVGSMGTAVIGLASLGDSSTESEIQEASRDLDGVKEDWSDNLAPIALMVGRGVTKVVDGLNITKEELKPDGFEFKMPHINLEPIEPLEINVSHKLIEGITSTPDEDFEANTEAEEGNDAVYSTFATGAAGVSYGGSQITGAASSRPTYHQGKSTVYGSRTTVTQNGVALSEMTKYSYNESQRSVGAKGGGKMRKINKIIIHCTDTYKGVEYSVQEIDRWHKQRTTSDGRHWSGIGYHFVVHLDGSIESGRPLNMAGAHCEGQNSNSIGIVYVGGRVRDKKAKNGYVSTDTRTYAQKRQIWNLVLYLQRFFPNTTVHGHREFANKLCPCFDVQKEWRALRSNNFVLESEEQPHYAAAVDTRTISSSQVIDDIYSQKGDLETATANEV